MEAKRNLAILDQVMEEQRNKPDKILTIFNPRDVPFGPLSNNAIYFMNIDNKKWPTVTNYVLSNMLITPMYRNILATAKIDGNNKKVDVNNKLDAVIANVEARQGYKLSPNEVEKYRQIVIQDIQMQRMNVWQLYNYYLGQEQLSTIRRAVEKAYNSKVSQNPDMAQTLINSGSAPIYYVSNNETLGIGPNRQGLNLVGVILMQIRHNLLIGQKERQDQSKINDKRSQVFNTYKAYVILRRELASGNDLSAYIGKSAPKIIEHFFRANPDETDENIGIFKDNEDVILQMYNRGQYPQLEQEIKTPGYLVKFMRRGEKTNSGFQGGLRQLREDIEEKRANKILELYTEYTIDKQYPQMSAIQKTEASKQLLKSSPNIDEYLRLRNKVIELYNSGLFSERLTKQIEDALSLLPLPTTEDIERAEQMKGEPMFGSREEKSSTSTIGEDDNLKQLFATDTKKIKLRLIQKLVSHTGHSEKKYKNYSIEKLQDKLKQYEVEEDETEESSDSDSDDEQKQYVKPFGTPIEIYPMPNENKKEWQVFSPIEKSIFFIDGSSYPSVSLYITAMLITLTGVRTNLKGNTVYMRGTSVTEARKLLIKSRTDEFVDKNIDFLDPDQANAVYYKRNQESHQELMATFCTIALKNKFSNRDMQNLLLLTGERHLVWNDRNDVFLGSGTENHPGENYVGQELMRLRSKIRDKREVETYPRVDGDNLKIFMTGDEFMSRWIKMRLEDMCSTVHRMKQFLYDQDKIDEEIDPRFVRIVLDNVYQPCSQLIAFSKEIEVPVPESFVNMVMRCKGMKINFSKNFEQEIKNLDQEQNQLNSDFWGRVNNPQSNVINPDNLLVQQQEEIGELERSGASRDVIKKVKKRHKKEYKLAVQEKKESNIPFPDRQRIEWGRELKRILAPDLSEQEIKQRLKLFRKQQKKELKKKNFVDDNSREQFINNQRRRLLEERKNLYQPRLSQQERNREIRKLTEKQRRDYNKFYGIRDQPRTKQQIAQHRERLQDIVQRRSDLSRERNEEIAHWKYNMTDIAQVYWDRMVVMVYFLIQYIRDANTQDIRYAIASIELLNSSPTSCKGLNINLSNEEDNCISSALINILIGIEEFKYQYGDNIPFGTNDIDLAGSIIVSRNINNRDINIPTENDIEEEIEEEEIIDFDNDMASAESSVEDFADYGDEPGTFGMGRPVDKIEQVNNMLRAIVRGPIKDIDELSRYFIGMIKTIKEFRMSPQVKQNRINFFATLR